MREWNVCWGSLELQAVFLSLTHVKVKVLVSHSCPALSNAMDSNPPGSSVHRILQARIREWLNNTVMLNNNPLLQGIFPTQGQNLALLHCRQILYRFSHQGLHTCVYTCNWVLYAFCLPEKRWYYSPSWGRKCHFLGTMSFRSPPAPS